MFFTFLMSRFLPIFLIVSLTCLIREHVVETVLWWTTLRSLVNQIKTRILYGKSLQVFSSISKRKSLMIIGFLKEMKMKSFQKNFKLFEKILFCLEKSIWRDFYLNFILKAFILNFNLNVNFIIFIKMSTKIDENQNDTYVLNIQDVCRENI